MIQVLFIIAIIAFGVLLYFKNKADNRKIDRHNRLADRQETFMKMLQEKTAKEKAKQDKEDDPA
jgi:hypothetical protein